MASRALAKKPRDRFANGTEFAKRQPSRSGLGILGPLYSPSRKDCLNTDFPRRIERIKESTKQGNKRVAEQMEAARKTQLAEGEVGIEDRKPIPTLREFAPQLEEAIETQCAEAAIAAYQQKARPYQIAP